MNNRHDTDKALTLFTQEGERKYLSQAERARFHAALDMLDEASRTFCEMIYWTGCRPSEALALTTQSINVEAGYVVIRSLKKRRAQKGRHFRIVPLPRGFVGRLDAVHGLSRAQGEAVGAVDTRLWRFSRTTGWVRMAAVMKAAGVTGVRACARGLRHSFGVHAAMRRVPETRIQKWLGHANLATTAIYLDMAALEDRHMAQKMWTGVPPPPALTGAGVTNSELVRLVCAYSAITAPEPRMAFLDSIEARADKQQQSTGV